MTDLHRRLTVIEDQLHRLETATPRNSATVDRGQMSVVDEGSLTVSDGGEVRYEDGGSIVSSDFDSPGGSGWQVGTERRGTSVVVVNDIPGYPVEVSTADSFTDYLEVPVDSESLVVLGEYRIAMVSLFHVTDTPGELRVGGRTVHPTNVVKDQTDQYAYAHMGTFDADFTIQTTMSGVSARVLLVSVNNVA